MIALPIDGDGTNAKSKAALAALRGDVMPKIEAQLPTGSEAGVTGTTAQNKDFNDSMKAHLPIVFLFVLGTAFVLLLFTFRSIVIPIKAILLNLLSVGAAYGLLVEVFQNGHGQGSSASSRPARSPRGCRCSCSSCSSGSRWTTTCSSSRGSARRSTRA